MELGLSSGRARGAARGRLWYSGIGHACLLRFNSLRGGAEGIKWRALVRMHGAGYPLWNRTPEMHPTSREVTP